MMATLIFACADILNCGGIKFQMKHPWNFPKQGEVFKDILQRVILTAGFEDTTPSECEIICMWMDGLKDEVTSVMFNGHRETRLKLDCNLVYPGMTAGVWCTSLSCGIITAPLPFEPEDE